MNDVDFNQAAAALATTQLSAQMPSGGTLYIYWSGAPLVIPATGGGSIPVQLNSEDAVAIISNLPSAFNTLPVAAKKAILEQMFRAYFIGYDH